MKVLELEDIKDLVAQDRGFNNWIGKLNHENKGLFEIEVLDRITDEIAMRYADQFTPKWTNVNKCMPESFLHLVVQKDGLIRTDLLLIMTETGSVYSNRRLKMAIGEMEWVWEMGISDEKIIFWTIFPSSLKKLP